MTWNQHPVVIFQSDLRRRTHLKSTKSFWNKCCHVTNQKNKYYWNHGHSTYQLRAATRPLFYWLGGAVRGSYLSTGGVRSDPCVCSSGGEPFDLYPSCTSLPTSPLMAPEHLLYGVAICLTGLRFKREKWKSEKKVLHGSWCKIRRTYIASNATYSKHDEYKDDDSRNII